MNLMSDSSEQAQVDLKDLGTRTDVVTGKVPSREHELKEGRLVKLEPKSSQAVKALQERCVSYVDSLKAKVTEGKSSEQDQSIIDALTRVAGISVKGGQIREDALLDVIKASYFLEQELRHDQEEQVDIAKQGPTGLLEVKYRQVVTLEESLLKRQQAGENVTAELAAASTYKSLCEQELSRSKATEQTSLQAFLAIEEDKVIHLRSQALQLEEQATAAKNNAQELIRRAEAAAKLFKDHKSPTLIEAEERLEKATEEAETASEAKTKAKKELDEANDRKTDMPGLITAAEAEEQAILTSTQKVIDVEDTLIATLEAQLKTAKSSDKLGINEQLTAAREIRASQIRARGEIAQKLAKLKLEQATIGSKITELGTKDTNADTFLQTANTELTAATTGVGNAKTPEDKRLEAEAATAKQEADKAQKEAREAEEKAKRINAEKTGAEREWSLFKSEIAAIEKSYTEKDRLAREISDVQAEIGLLVDSLISSRSVFEKKLFGLRQVLDPEATGRAIRELRNRLKEIKERPLYELLVSYNLQKEREESTRQARDGQAEAERAASSPATPDLATTRAILEKPENLSALQQLAKDYQAASKEEEKKRVANEAATRLGVPVDMLLLLLWIVLGEIGKSFKT